jgi:zinc protease
VKFPGAGSAYARQSPPPIAAPRPFRLPSLRTVELDNGLRATFLEHGFIPKVTVAIAIRAGEIHAGRKTWLPRLTADLLKEGTARRSAAQLAEEAASMGGKLSITATEDETWMHMDVLSEFGGCAIALLAEMLTNPSLVQRALERVRGNHLRDLSVQRGYPGVLANHTLAAHLYGGHPYGSGLPRPEQLRSYTIDDIRSFHAENFGAHRASVYVVGMFDSSAIEESLRESLGSWHAGSRARPDQAPPTSKQALRLIGRPAAPQCSLRIGVRVPGPSHADFISLLLTNTLLGGTLTSRITMNLREDKGWVYSPLSELVTLERASAWIEFVDVRTDKTAAALAEIRSEIERLREQTPTATDLAAIKSYQQGAFNREGSSRLGLVMKLAFVDLHGLPRDWLTRLTDRIDAVTAEDVTRVARSYLLPDEMSVVAVGDLASLRSQLTNAEL